MKQKQDENHTQVQNLERLKGKENITQSGQKIDVCANIGTREDIENVLRSDAGGIGLFRSEFLYIEMGQSCRQKNSSSRYTVWQQRQWAPKRS